MTLPGEVSANVDALDVVAFLGKVFGGGDCRREDGEAEVRRERIGCDILEQCLLISLLF
jgi:hypothetical protein